MAAGAGLLHRHAADAGGVPVEQFGRSETPGEQDCAGRHLRARLVAGQRAQQPSREVLQVGQPLAQIGIGDAAHPVVQLAGDPLHRRLGRQPAADHLGHAFQPAGIGRDQAIGLQHVARRRHFRAAGQIVRHAGDQLVETLLHALRRLRAGARVRPAGCRRAAAPGGGGSRAARPDRWRCRGPASSRRRRAGSWRRRLPPPRRRRRPTPGPRRAASPRFPIRPLRHRRSCAGCGSAPRPRPAFVRRAAPGRPAWRRTVPRRSRGGRRRQGGSAHPAGSSPGRWRRTGRRCPRRRAAGCGRRPAG